MEGINSTADFYRNGPVDLMQEYTICESLSRRESSYMTVLETPRTYAESVIELLDGFGLFRRGACLCEAGGGYGSLMRGLLEAAGGRIDRVVMVDLSFYLLERQRLALEPWASKISFVNGDIETLLPVLSGIDLAIVNEVIGDLPTWVGIDGVNLPVEIARLAERYDLDLPRTGRFNFNMGAVHMMEALCRGRGAAFITEHSSDPIIPSGMDYLARGLETDGYPREIRLAGHREYTIRFSHLMAVARYFGRDVKTGSLAEAVGIADSPRNRAVFLGRMTGSDEQEIRYELLDHIREYRWMIIR